MAKFYYFLGGLGSNVEKVARDFSEKNPDYVFIDFISILLSRDSYVDKEQIVSYPPYLNTQAYAETKLAVGLLIEKAVKDRKPIILYGAGINVQINLNFMDYLRQLKYKIITLYVKVKIEKQLEIVSKINMDSNSRIFIPPGVVIDTQHLLDEAIKAYELASNKFKVI